MKTCQAAFLLPMLLLACAPERPEARLKRTFEACVKGVETGNPAAVIECLDPQFTGPGGMDKRSAKLYLMGILKREKIGVTIFSSRIEVKGHDALQTVELVLTSRGESGLLPQDASRRTFLLKWIERDKAWRLRELLDASGGEGAN